MTGTSWSIQYVKLMSGLQDFRCIYCWDERLTFCVNFSRQRWAKLIPQMTESNISPDIISETIQQQTRYVYFFYIVTLDTFNIQKRM